MGVALEKTQSVKVGPWVTVPIGARYHPAIIAQAAATLDNLYPGRFMLGIGTGEALNERPFWNGKWPKWEERMNRLVEGVELIRRLWESAEPFKFEGKYFSSDFYYLYTKPARKIPIYCSAIGKRTAYAAGAYTDGLITMSPRNDLQKLREIIIPAYLRGRNESNKKGLGKIALELHVSFANPEELMKNAWRTLGSKLKDSWSMPTPIAVEKEGGKVTVEDLRRTIHFCKNWKELVKLIEAYQEIRVNEVNIYAGCDKKLIRALAKNVLEVF
jgi:coenzyme F420-dependent glucose-6-phosphate dehydrogenase